MRTPNFIAAVCAAPLALAACATPSAQDMAEGDPLEGVNRGVHGFNEALAEHVVVPVANAAKSNTSESGRSTTGEVLHHVGNVLDNLGEPKNAVNGALQGNAGTVGTAVVRFGLNSTVGLLGVYDVAGAIGLERRQEDFGQTLGSWGAPSGPYMVAPVAGPTNTRDVAGMVVDGVLNPVGLIPIPGEAMTAARTGVTAAEAIDSAEVTADAAQTEDDAYAAARTRYDGRRDAQIANVAPLPARAMAPIEHRGDSPAPAAAAPVLPASIAAPALRPLPEPQDDVDDPVRIGPRTPLVIDIYPVDPAR